MRSLVILTLLCLPTISRFLIAQQTQTRPMLHGYFSVTRNHFKMDSINENVLNIYINEVPRLEHGISIGSSYDFGFGLSYTFLDIGLSSNLNKGISENETQLMTFVDNEIKEVDGYFLARSRAISFSIYSRIFLSDILLSVINRKPEFFQKLRFGIDCSAGYGRSTFDMYHHIPEANESGQVFSRSPGLVSKIGLLNEYKIINKNVELTIGIRAGYQFFKTQTLKRISGDEVIGFGSTPPNLDFSGFYYGIYLKFGK